MNASAAHSTSCVGKHPGQVPYGGTTTSRDEFFQKVIGYPIGGRQAAVRVCAEG